MRREGGVTEAGIIARIADAAIRRALGLDYSRQLELLPESIKLIAVDVVDSVAFELVSEKSGSLRCGICGKGPFTRKGLYLHIRRVHIDIVQEMVSEEVKRRLWARKLARDEGVQL